MVSSKTIKRIMSDIKQLQKDSIDKHGIYYHFDDTNIFNIKVLMIGPSDTPYENGFFFFDINYPNDYPLSPPIVKFCTLDGTVRFNPNLYVCGKVCLSLINTWSGPGWTPCNTIVSVILSIQALVFTKYPLMNEPGYENEEKKILQQYNDVIYHETIRVAVIQMIKKIPLGFNPFIKKITQYFNKNIDWYIQRCTDLHEKYDCKQVRSPIYGMIFNCKYLMLRNTISLLKSDIDKKLKITESGKILCCAIFKNGNICTYKANKKYGQYCGYHRNYKK